MLMLTRKTDEQIVIDPGGLNITILVRGFEGAGGRERARVKLGIRAPRDLVIMRTELLTNAERDRYEIRPDDDEERMIS